MPGSTHFARSSSFRELLVIDQQPLFRAARDECDRACQKLEELKAEIRQHETHDLSAYERWINANFGAYITEIRQAGALLVEKERSLASARKKHWAGFFGGSVRQHMASEGFCGMDAQYQTFVDEESEGYHEVSADEDDNDHDDEFGFEDLRYETDDHSDDPENFWFENDAELNFGDTSTYSRIRMGAGGRFQSSSERQEKAKPLPNSETLTVDSVEGRLKARYRLLVKVLHPDMNADLIPERKKLWNQVQVAYREKNLDQLDLLLALAEAFSGMVSESTSLDQLRKAAFEIQRAIAPLQRKIDAFQKDRAWKFSTLSDRAALHATVESEYQHELYRLQQNLDNLEATMKRFSPAAKQSSHSVQEQA